MSPGQNKDVHPHCSRRQDTRSSCKSLQRSRVLQCKAIHMQVICRGDLLSMSLSFIQRPCMHHTECQTTLPCTMHWSDTDCLYYWSPSRQSCSLTIADFAPNTILKYKFNPCKMGISLFWTSGRWSVKKTHICAIQSRYNVWLTQAHPTNKEIWIGTHSSWDFGWL